MPPRKKKATEENPAPVKVDQLYDPALAGDGWNQPPLESMPSLPARRSRKGAPETRAGVQWARYKVQKPVHCDDCLLQVHATWNVPEVKKRAPNFACYRRTEKGVPTYHCWEHTEEKRRADGLTPLKTKGK